MKSLNRFTAYSIRPVEMELGRMILDVSPHYLAKPLFSISLQGGAVGAHLSRFSHRLTVYTSHTIELKLGKMLLGHSAQSLGVGFFDIPQKALCGCAS